MKQAASSRGMLVVALLCGVVGGIVLSHDSEPHYSFVHGAAPMQVADLGSDATKGTVRIYNLHMDWNDVVSDVVKDSPLSVVKDIDLKGIPGKAVVVPREEGGRAKLFETPDREITVIKGKFVLSESGSALARAGDGSWSGIRVVEFHRPHLLDTATDWVHETFKV